MMHVFLLSEQTIRDRKLQNWLMLKQSLKQGLSMPGPSHESMIKIMDTNPALERSCRT